MKRNRAAALARQRQRFRERQAARQAMPPRWAPDLYGIFIRAAPSDPWRRIGECSNPAFAAPLLGNLPPGTEVAFARGDPPPSAAIGESDA